MKQSTFSAQVANNLLMLLQGYSKTIRLLLVMFLTLTASTAWGAKITTYSSIVTGKTYYIGATTSGTDYYLSVSGASESASIAGTAVTTKANATAFVFTGSGTSWEIKFADYANYLGLNSSKDNGKVQVVSSAATFTASNQSEKLRLSIGSYSIQKNNSGTQFGSYGNTQTDIWLEEASTEPYTVKFYKTSTTFESVTETSAGAGVTPPTMEEECGDWTFQGWSESSSNSETSTTPLSLVTLTNGKYYPTEDVNLYPVYTKSEGGGGTVSWNKITTAPADWSGEYLIVNSNYAMISDFYSGTSGEFKGASVTVSNNQVTSSPSDKMIWIVEKNGSTAQYSFKNKSTGTYANITGTGSKNAALSKSAIWFTISSSSTSGVWKINSVTYSARCFAYYSTNTTFRTYANSSNTTGSLYKKEGSGSTTYYYSYPDCGTPTPTPTLNVDPATLTFENTTTNTSTQKTFTLTGSNLTANASLQLSGINPGMFSLSSNSVTQSADSINQTITVTYTPTATGEHTATLTISSTGAESKTVALSGTGTAPAAKYTVTFNAGSGTCDDESLTETSGGAGVTLPTANPPAACATDGWEFAGWWTGSVAETTTSPGELLTVGSNYKPTTNCTLYAVYSYTEAGGGGSTDYVLTNIGDIDDDDIVVITMTTSGGTTYAMSNNNGTSAPTATSVTVSGSTLTGDIADNLKWNITNNAGSLTIYPNGTTSTWLYCTNTNNGVKVGNTEDGKAFTIDATSGYLKNTYTSRYVGVYTTNPDWRCYTSTTTNIADQTLGFYVKSSGGSTTTYNSNPVCVASWSITYDFEGGTGSHCSNTSVPQGDPYTICDEAPTKEGHTFQGWSDGTSTYAAGATITPTKNTTLTAQWQIKTYTVIWSNNGATTEESYEHGETLNVPDPNDIPSCDGEKEFVGWTEQSGYYHATTAPTDLFKTITATVTADKTYYAVFATKGAGGTEFVLGESGTFKMYANVNGTNYYAQGGVSSSQITSTTNALSASDYTLTHKGSNQYTIQFGNAYIGHSGSTSTNLNTIETLWKITAGENGSWRITSPVNESRALAYRASTYNIFKAYSMTNVEAGDTEYFDIEFGTGSSGYSDYTTTCQPVESIEVQSPQTEFYLTDDFTIGSGKVIATLSGGGTTDVTDLAHFSGYNMEATGTQTVTVTYMGATATYEITVKPLDNAWVLTWNVSGKTNTGLGPRSVTKGSAIGTLPTPVVPDACAGKTFMGWTESNIVPSDGKGIVYITEATVPSKNTTYYAVFATINNFSTQAAIEDITSGSKVVIVAVASMDASGGAGQAISSRTISITSQGVIGLSGDEVSIFDETINTPHSTCIWTLTKEGGGIVLEQGGKYIRAVNDGYRKLLLETTKDYWTLSPVTGKDKTYHMQSGNTSHYVEWFDHTDSKYAEGERYIGFVPYTEANDNGDFDMQFYVTANADGNADITDYTTGCAEYTITYYGFHGGYSTSCSSDGTIVLPVNSLHTVPNCGDVVKDHTNLGREFLNVWMTQPHGGHTFKPGDTFILTQDTTLYAQWKMETTSDVTTLPTDVEDLAGTDIYVYGGTTLNIQPGTTTINSLTLKGGLQADGSYKMPTVWVPEGATLVRNSNKINLDLKVNAKNYYPFAVPFAAKNNANVEYLDPVLAAASTYGTHFAIKTYNGARRADVGEDKANNWVRVLRDETLQPGVGYIITALTYPDKDTATIRIPMTVPNTWFQNGEQAEVGTTVRNTIAVTAHAGAAATEHQRHAGWNFVANPYLTSFTGGNVANDGGLAYINGELIIEGSYEYGGEDVPYVTIPAYDFAYYSQHKLSDVKLSPEWSFFVQVGTGGTMNFTTAGRQQAPASIAARNAEERPVKMDVDLILSDNHSSDQTGIIISDRYTDAYEIGRDLEKLFGSAYNLSVYTLMEDNTPLAFQALAIRSSMQVIPVGYRAPEQGEYTFRLNEATSSIDLLNEQYEQLVLVDYQTGELTNLLYTDYTFYSERTQSNSRFAIYAVPRQNAPTDLPNAIGSDEEVRKVIYNDHLYILRDGNVYNGMGQKM